MTEVKQRCELKGLEKRIDILVKEVQQGDILLEDAQFQLTDMMLKANPPQYQIKKIVALFCKAWSDMSEGKC